MDFNEWLELGMAQGYITEPYCDTHEGAPYTDAEAEMWDSGEDPCSHSVRLIAGHDELKELARD